MLKLEWRHFPLLSQPSDKRAGRPAGNSVKICGWIHVFPCDQLRWETHKMFRGKICFSYRPFEPPRTTASWRNTVETCLMSTLNLYWLRSRLQCWFVLPSAWVKGGTCFFFKSKKIDTNQPKTIFEKTLKLLDWRDVPKHKHEFSAFGSATRQATQVTQTWCAARDLNWDVSRSSLFAKSKSQG